MYILLNMNSVTYCMSDRKPQFNAVNTQKDNESDVNKHVSYDQALRIWSVGLTWLIIYRITKMLETKNIGDKFDII